jgi:hypothetical protein
MMRTGSYILFTIQCTPVSDYLASALSNRAYHGPQLKVFLWVKYLISKLYYQVEESKDIYKMPTKNMVEEFVEES